MKKKSLEFNAILNMLKVLINLIFPLITFPYVSRVLGADNLGKVQFGDSVVAYFQLFAMLGITSYAMREGAIIRDNKEKFNKLASELFTINLIFTLLSYILLIIVLFLPTKLVEYRKLIMLQSLTIIFTTIGVDWIYAIFEDYVYITIKSILTYAISMLLLFLLVKTSGDYYKYAFVQLMASSSVFIFNFFHARKYCNLKLTKHPNIRKHIKQLLILFSNALSIKIYITSDVTLLGLMTSGYYVGIYGVSVKVYNIVKNLLNAIIAVAVPRMTIYAQNKNNFQMLGEKILNVFFILVIPSIIGICSLSKYIILIISGQEYIRAVYSLIILSFALICAVGSNFFCNAVLVPNKEENKVLKGTLLAATINVILNIFLISKYQEIGAAITTLLAEFIVLVVSIYYSRKYFKIKNVTNTLITSFIGCIAIVVICGVIKKCFVSKYIICLVSIILSVPTYFIILIILGNNLVLDFLKNFFEKIKKKKEYIDGKN